MQLTTLTLLAPQTSNTPDHPTILTQYTGLGARRHRRGFGSKKEQGVIADFSEITFLGTEYGGENRACRVKEFAAEELASLLYSSVIQPDKIMLGARFTPGSPEHIDTMVTYKMAKGGWKGRDWRLRAPSRSLWILRDLIFYDEYGDPLSPFLAESVCSGSLRDDQGPRNCTRAWSAGYSGAKPETRTKIFIPTKKDDFDWKTTSGHGLRFEGDYDIRGGNDNQIGRVFLKEREIMVDGIITGCSFAYRYFVGYGRDPTNKDIKGPKLMLVAIKQNEEGEEIEDVLYESKRYPVFPYHCDNLGEDHPGGRHNYSPVVRVNVEGLRVNARVGVRLALKFDNGQRNMHIIGEIAENKKFELGLSITVQTKGPAIFQNDEWKGVSANALSTSGSMARNGKADTQTPDPWIGMRFASAVNVCGFTLLQQRRMKFERKDGQALREEELDQLLAKMQVADNVKLEVRDEKTNKWVTKEGFSLPDPKAGKPTTCFTPDKKRRTGAGGQGISNLPEGVVLVNPEEASRSYSSVWSGQSPGTGHARSMLDSEQGWSAQHNRKGEYMTIDAGSVVKVAGLCLQQRNSNQYNQYVRKFTVEVSKDDETYVSVDDGHVFKGSSSKDQPSVKRTALFKGPIEARFIRIFPTDWHKHMTMRVGYLRAPPTSKARSWLFENKDLGLVGKLLSDRTENWYTEMLYRIIAKVAPKDLNANAIVLFPKKSVSASARTVSLLICNPHKPSVCRWSVLYLNKTHKLATLYALREHGRRCYPRLVWTNNYRLSKRELLPQTVSELQNKTLPHPFTPNVSFSKLRCGTVLCARRV